MRCIFIYIVIYLLQIHPCCLLPLTFLSEHSSSPLIGYISFFDTVSYSSCFAAKSTFTKNDISFISIATPLSTINIIDKLHLSSLSYQTSLHFILEESKLSKYLNIITEHSFSLSLSYIALSTETYINTYNTSSSTSFYSQEGLNTYDTSNYMDFILKCGDSVITSYDKGMLMIYSIKVIFNNSQDKDMFYKRNKINTIEQGEIDFNSIILKLKLMANIAGVFDLNIEIHAIQIGGEYLNDLIYESMINDNNDFLIRNCTLNNIEKCMEVFPQLSEYFYNYTTFQMKKENYIFLEYFNHMQVLSGNDGLDLRNKNILHKIQNIKMYNNVLKHIVEAYPIHVEKIFELYNEISKQKEIMFNNNHNKYKLSNCLRQNYEYEICIQEFKFLFEIEMFVDKVNDYLSKHRSEDVLEADFQYQSCLPKYMKWFYEGVIQIRTFNKKSYIYNSLGLQCYFTNMKDFSCNDGVVYLDCFINEEEDLFEVFLICENKMLFKKIYYYTALKYKSSENKFFRDLKEIE